jgi:hypothetical protein
MDALNKGIDQSHPELESPFQCSAQSVALADTKRRFHLITDDIFHIAAYRYYSNYPQQCFVLLFIDSGFTPSGISDWHPLTLNLRKSRAFHLFVADHPELQHLIIRDNN